MNRILDKIEGFIFDLDGTIYLGDALLPGAGETLIQIRQMGKKVLFISNKPLEPRETYAAKLSRLGIPTSPKAVITSGFVLARVLADRFLDLNYYVIGEENLKNELRGQGLMILEELWEQDERQVIRPADIDAVVVAFDRTLDYRKLNTGYQALRDGASFFATNPDKTCPMPGGDIPDAGATIAYLEYLTHRKPELIAGKPSPLMVQVAMEMLSLPPEKCLMIGDRLETDIRMGKLAGVFTAAVTTGATTRDEAETNDQKPDWIFDSIAEILTR